LDNSNGFILQVEGARVDHGGHTNDFAAQLCQQPSNADLTQLTKAIYGIVNADKLTAAKSYYVNGTTGDDNFAGTSPAAPFKTIQRAINQASVFNLNGFNILISVANGVYGPARLPAINGTGNIAIVGNAAIPANCIIHANTGPALSVFGGPYIVTGLRFESDLADPAGGPGAGIWCVGGNLVLNNNTSSEAVEFGFCSDAHINALQGVVAIGGSSIVRIAGNSARHAYSQIAGWIYSGAYPTNPSLVIPGSTTIGTFVECGQNANTNLTYAAISGKANVIGSRYSANSNGIISNGGGATYYPGTTAGTISTGGQYL
jgi:hypothetical protein